DPGRPASTAGRPSQTRVAPLERDIPEGRLSEREDALRRPRVVDVHDLARGVALLRHGLGAPLAHPYAVAVPPPREVGDLRVHRDREEGGLEGVVAEHASEIVAAQT